LSFVVDLAFVIVAFEVIFFGFLADVLALVFPRDAAAPRADFAAKADFDADADLDADAGLPAEADLAAEEERPGDFFAVELLAAADFVTPLLTPDLACVLDRAAEPLARAAAVEAVADDFFSAFLLEGIRGLLLCCPAVETGRSLPLTAAQAAGQQAATPRGRHVETLLAPHTQQPGLWADPWEREALEFVARRCCGAGSPSTRRSVSV
jgi:hypothetical protein